jgi:signal transduction histidine kinase
MATMTSIPDAEDPNAGEPVDLQQVAGAIAHDLNNLLSVVRNYASFIVDESATASTGSGPERWQLVHRDAQQIEIAVERALLLVAERIQPLANS